MCYIIYIPPNLFHFFRTFRSSLKDKGPRFNLEDAYSQIKDLLKKYRRTTKSEEVTNADTDAVATIDPKDLVISQSPKVKVKLLSLK